MIPPTMMDMAAYCEKQYAMNIGKANAYAKRAAFFAAMRTELMKRARKERHGNKSR